MSRDSDSEGILILATLEIFEVKGRGMVHIVDMPDDFIADTDPRKLVGKIVELDGIQRRVCGVEAFAVPFTPGSHALKRVGLLVCQDETEDKEYD